jgi:hypothetical protein
MARNIGEKSFENLLSSIKIQKGFYLIMGYKNSNVDK